MVVKDNMVVSEEIAIQFYQWPGDPVISRELFDHHDWWEHWPLCRKIASDCSKVADAYLFYLYVLNCSLYNFSLWKQTDETFLLMPSDENRLVDLFVSRPSGWKNESLPTEQKRSFYHFSNPSLNPFRLRHALTCEYPTCSSNANCPKNMENKNGGSNLATPMTTRAH